MTKVADIASIRNGYAFRGRVESDKDGDTRVIQASDLTDDTELDKDKLVCVQLGKKASRYELSENDIVFMARGLRQRAYRPIRHTVTGKPIITAFGLLVISAREHMVIPEYLHWVLNTRRVQQHIQVLKEGTGITFISDKKFSNVEIPLPPLETQRKITRLIDLHTQRAHVRQQLATIDEKIAQATAWSLATEQTQ